MNLDQLRQDTLHHNNLYRSSERVGACANPLFWGLELVILQLWVVELGATLKHLKMIRTAAKINDFYIQVGFSELIGYYEVAGLDVITVYLIAKQYIVLR